MKGKQLFIDLKESLNEPIIRGKLAENIGLGIFVNGGYGVSDGSIELFNMIDITLGILLLFGGIILQRSTK